MNYRRIALAGVAATVMAAGRLVEWIVVGITIGLVYKPATAAPRRAV
jgi:hypothetical protein